MPQAKDPKYDVIVIGAGLSGLAAASLLAKAGLKTAVIEHSNKPGGICGIFKREDAIFDQGAAMLFGFGEKGFNSHRFLFNCLEEPIAVIEHKLLYTVHYDGHAIPFPADIDMFTKELSKVFPGQRQNIQNFYSKMKKLYTKVISENPTYTTPDETNLAEGIRALLRHPLAYMKFLAYMNISTKKLLKKYFTDPEILHFFDKLTSTYCYASVSEAPAILASVMFVDNHVGGSFYPAGSTMFVPGTMEKSIEENGGDMYYSSTVKTILFRNNRACGVLLEEGKKIYAGDIVYSGSVWDLYGRLIAREDIPGNCSALAAQIPTHSSIVLYALVNKKVFPEGTCPIEMLASSPGTLDESEITVYIPGIDDHTVCPPGQYTVTAIGPTFVDWNTLSAEEYERQKGHECSRIIHRLEQHFPGFVDGIIISEMATPLTIERYTLKPGGAAAGPKQMLGQHMLKRQHTRTECKGLYCCGESTVMGTGTPTVTVSGIAAANAILKDRGLAIYKWQPDMASLVRVLEPPVTEGWMETIYGVELSQLMKKSQRCEYCTEPSCCSRETMDIPGIMRRISCGNFVGAMKTLQHSGLISALDLTDSLEDASADNEPLHQSEDVVIDETLTTFLAECEKKCIRAKNKNDSVRIREIIEALPGRDVANRK